MLPLIREWLAPPVFEDDEDKTRTARVLNTLLLIVMLFLILGIGIIVPFVFVEKLYNSMFLLGLFLALATAHWQMRRGRVRLASVIWVSAMWITFTIFVSLAGGITSIIAVFYVVNTVITGLLLGTRAALIHALACILAGLGMLILESSGHPLPRIFPVPPTVGWVDLTIALLLATAVLNLVLRGLKEALALARRQVEERKQAETERERLLVQVQEQAQRVQHIVDTVPEGVILLDPDLCVLMANPLGKKDMDALAGAQTGDTLTRLGDRSIEELLTSPPKGLWHEVAVEHRSFQVIARPIENGPTPKGWVVVMRDVTQQREVERRIQQQERLATVGQLAAGMAHDFNNIMAVIALYAGLSLRALDLPNKERERLQTIDEQAHRASRLIQQILDFSRRAVLERGPLDLVAFLKEQIKLLQRTLPEHIHIDMAYDEDEYTINADPTRIQQAVMNLATNARDAMPEGGRLHFGLERIAFAERDALPMPEMKPGQWICLTVADTGVGILPETQPYVFDPFFTTKEPGKGTGLGLAQVYGIVKQHEGHIDFATEPGRGTTFTLYLPALSAPQPPITAIETEPLPQGQGQTILVVEDEAATRGALVESLKVLNYRVLEATNGQQALEVFEQHAGAIDLVLSDVVMPEMGGKALLYALQERDPAVRLVLLSGHPQHEQELEDLRALGLRSWTLKPLSLEHLARVVAEAMSSASR